MSDRMNPQMRAAKARQDALAAQYPLVTITGDRATSRVVNETISLAVAGDAPAMAVTEERWVPARGRRVLCRMHRPSNAKTLPLLIWLHGGGWVFGTIDTHDKLVREYAAGAGVACVSIDYALAPETPFPGALLECAAVVRAIVADAAGWGIDPDRVLIGGDSAGGNLAWALALFLRDTGGPALRGLLTPYPVAEGACDSASFSEFAEGFGLTRVGMMAYWDAYMRDEVDRLNPIASPLRGDLRGLPPALVQLAELDVLRDEGVALAEKAIHAGVDVTLEQFPGVLHGFMRLSNDVDEARDAIASACVWLRRVTG